MLVSGDLEGTMKLWDIANGKCVQTISRAHNTAIMRMLLYEVRKQLVLESICAALHAASVDACALLLWRPTDGLVCAGGRRRLDVICGSMALLGRSGPTHRLSHGVSQCTFTRIWLSPLCSASAVCWGLRGVVRAAQKWIRWGRCTGLHRLRYSGGAGSD